MVSVLLPVFNAGEYIGECLKSLIDQSFNDFEILIYDDNSIDETVGIIETVNDKRIKLYRKPNNTGLTKSLIAGIQEAKGKYIARMDADDISEPTRLEKQVHFLENNPDYGIVGSFLKPIENGDLKAMWSYPVEHQDIVSWMVIDSPFVHPAIMMRKEVLIKNKLNYNSCFEPCEDYQLWFQLLKCTKGYNINEPLIYYRLHANQTIERRKKEVIEKSNLVRASVVNWLTGYKMTTTEMKIHYSFFNESHHNDVDSILLKSKWKNKWMKLSADNISLIELGKTFWSRNLRTLSEYNPSMLQYLFDKSLYEWTLLQKIKFVAKCCIFYKVRKN